MCLVRAEVVAVNNVDTFVRSGSYQTALPFPFIVGRDVVACCLSTSCVSAWRK
jgi:NADPH:quinone reductase-like Zn-dependent oxidoreductase